MSHMSDEFHRDLMVESRADGEALHELGKRIRALPGPIPYTRKSEFDALYREFEALHADFEMLHDQDMGGYLDRSAHRAWRERARRLAAHMVDLLEPNQQNRR
jgi:hypothetical protein